MDFSFYTVNVSRIFAKRLSIARAIRSPFETITSKLIGTPSSVLLVGLVFSQAAFATGDPAKGAANWDYLCNHCHGTPQPNNPAAFRGFGTTANPLSLYASNPVAITRATNVGYTIPQGNTNDDYDPGTSTAMAMGSFVGMGEKRMGVGDVPSQYAIDISAYLATYFELPGVPAITSVTAGNSQAIVNFTAAKSDLTILSYTVTANPGGISATGTASPITVQGLTNGTAYTFTVSATSNAGTGKPSSASNSVIPVATSPAVAVRSAPAAGAATVAPVVAVPAKPLTGSVPAPALNTSAKPAVTANVVAPNATKNIPGTPAPLPSAPPGKVASAQPVTTGNAATPASSLPAPTIVAVKPGSAEARVFFTVPQSAADLIASYTVVAYSGGAATGINATGASSPIKITGLTNGTEYSFYVFANGKAGARVPSAASNVVTPLSIFGN